MAATLSLNSRQASSCTDPGAALLKRNRAVFKRLHRPLARASICMVRSGRSELRSCGAEPAASRNWATASRVMGVVGVNYLGRPATTILAGWKRGMNSSVKLVSVPLSERH